MTKKTLIPSQLILGNESSLHEYVEKLMQEEFCSIEPKQPGCFCTECRKVKNRQHFSIVWISPEKNYSVDDAQVIFDRTQFALDPGQRFYFILDKAQTLNLATANRLLKVLEEPPTGYHFILLSTNIDAMLPTIISRCHVVNLTESDTAVGVHPLLAYFEVLGKYPDPTTFEQELKKLHLSDAQSLEIATQLLSVLIQKKRKLLLEAPDQEDNQEETEYEKKITAINTALTCLQKKLHKPPQSGSSELFWKNLFLTWPRL